MNLASTQKMFDRQILDKPMGDIYRRMTEEESYKRPTNKAEALTSNHHTIES